MRLPTLVPALPFREQVKDLSCKETGKKNICQREKKKKNVGCGKHPSRLRRLEHRKNKHMLGGKTSTSVILIVGASSGLVWRSSLKDSFIRVPATLTYSLSFLYILFVPGVHS